MNIIFSKLKTGVEKGVEHRWRNYVKLGPINQDQEFAFLKLLKSLARVSKTKCFFPRVQKSS